MRLRHVSGAKDLMKAHPNYIIDIQKDSVITIDSYLPKDQEIHMEIGMGKGQFIHTLASKNKNIFYIGVEKFDSVIVRALEKQIMDPQDNLLLIRTDANLLLNILSKKVQRIYLTFSDPWPKDRHAKRRLTHKNFLEIYEKLLVKDGEIHFKTDNIDLFEFSIQSLHDYGMDISFITRDLHNSSETDNVMTEFEERFSKQGNKINKLIAKFKEN